MVDTVQEREWLKQSLGGDPAAFEHVIRSYQRMIFSLAYRMTGSVSDAEDLAQDTFIRAYQQLDTYRGEAKFSSWLCRVAINACLNWRQKESRRKDIHERWVNETSTAEGNTPEHPDEPINQQVQAALDRLPAKQRAAVVLTVYQDMSHGEAARVLGCTEATVSWRVFAARAKLKRWLKPLKGTKTASDEAEKRAVSKQIFANE